MVESAAFIKLLIEKYSSTYKLIIYVEHFFHVNRKSDIFGKYLKDGDEQRGYNFVTCFIIIKCKVFNHSIGNELHIYHKPFCFQIKSWFFKQFKMQFLI